MALAVSATELRLYDTGTRVRKATLPKVPAPVLSVALNADGTRLILGTKSGVVQVWDVATAKLIKELTPVPLQPARLAGK
jgi:WD40 repeat protein